ncbi:MAG: DUF177 domain-containing protein [Oscillospiraceae bacterium]|nr:DUF177 domain-containing protein [Oscillospiraceae bacterium]
MVLELESVFNTPGFSLPFAFDLSEQPSELEGNGLPFLARPHVKGVCRNRAGVVELEGVVVIQLEAACDRCAATTRRELRVPLAYTLVQALHDESRDDEFILVRQFHFSPDPFIWESLVLAMPPQLLCRPDCRGLCPHCGQNRNEGICDCAAKEARMHAEEAPGSPKPLAELLNMF